MNTSIHTLSGMSSAAEVNDISPIDLTAFRNGRRMRVWREAAREPSRTIRVSPFVSRGRAILMGLLALSHFQGHSRTTGQPNSQPVNVFACGPTTLTSSPALAAAAARHDASAPGAAMTPRSSAAWRHRSRCSRARRGEALARRPGIDGRSQRMRNSMTKNQGKKARFCSSTCRRITLRDKCDKCRKRSALIEPDHRPPAGAWLPVRASTWPHELPRSY